MIQTTNITD